ncbi:MAG: hypothetical protein C5S49_02795 [Candidatus Methanogaster sp.]|nr:MAG: hypothetical protein C5S49_02795 [ANME-2 cluster archaeon]
MHPVPPLSKPQNKFLGIIILKIAYRLDPHTFKHSSGLLPDTWNRCCRHRVKELTYPIRRNNGQSIGLPDIGCDLRYKFIRTDPDGTRQFFLREYLFFDIQCRFDGTIRIIRLYPDKRLIDADSLERIRVARKDLHNPPGDRLVQSHINRQKLCVRAQPVGSGDRHSRMDAILPRLIRTCTGNPPARAPFRVCADHHRQPCKFGMPDHFDGREETVHIHEKYRPLISAGGLIPPRYRVPPHHPRSCRV